MVRVMIVVNDGDGDICFMKVEIMMKETIIVNSRMFGFHG